MYGNKESSQILLEAEARDDLFCAGARGNIEAMEEILAQGSSIDMVNSPNRGGETPLMWAAMRGQVAAMKVLLKAKAKPDMRDQHGFTALMGASQKGHLEAMKTLVNARADINAREPEDDETALVMAIHCARSDAVALLVELGAEKVMPARGARTMASLLRALHSCLSPAPRKAASDTECPHFASRFTAS